MRGLDRSGATGRAGRCAETLLVEQHENALTLNKVERKICIIGQTLHTIAIDRHKGNTCQDSFDQLLTQRVTMLDVGRAVLLGQLQSMGEADDAGHVLRPSTATAL